MGYLIQSIREQGKKGRKNTGKILEGSLSWIYLECDIQTDKIENNSVLTECNKARIIFNKDMQTIQWMRISHHTLGAWYTTDDQNSCLKLRTLWHRLLPDGLN